MFSGIFKYFKCKKPKEVVICTYTHDNVDNFLLSLNDYDITLLYGELIECKKCEIPEFIDILLTSLEKKCTKDDFDWISQEIKKDYKK
jgi:hypothetical protein